MSLKRVRRTICRKPISTFLNTECFVGGRISSSVDFFTLPCSMKSKSLEPGRQVNAVKPQKYSALMLMSDWGCLGRRYMGTAVRSGIYMTSYKLVFLAL